MITGFTDRARRVCMGPRQVSGMLEEHGPAWLEGLQHAYGLDL